jgi:hypothetical protein
VAANQGAEATRNRRGVIGGFWGRRRALTVGEGGEVWGRDGDAYWLVL